MYMHTKNKVSESRLSTDRGLIEQYRQTRRQTGSIIPAEIRGS